MTISKKILGRLIVPALVLAVATACSSGRGDAEEPIAVPPSTIPPPVQSDPDAFQELFDQGIDRYLGVFAPMLTDQQADGVTVYQFDGSSGGPLCYTGNQFQMSTRDGTRAELMIFLQGGGQCSPNSCNAFESAEPAVPPSFGILNGVDPSNPVEGYNVAYLPYCDGSLWMGDNDVDSDADGTDDRLFRGLQNLSASLDVIVGAYPAPSRIVIAGNSAGGFGTHPALPLVRKLYPGVPIELINDSGVGISPPAFEDVLFNYWNASAFFPVSCETCIGDDGNLTDYHSYQLSEAANARFAFLSTKQDAVVTSDGPEFERQLIEAMAELNDTYPDRFQSLIGDGDGHTFIVREFDKAVGGTTVRQWIAAMLNADPAWTSVSD